MQTSVPAEQETDAPTDNQTDHELPTDALRVGVDIEGATHYYSRIHETMYVIDEAVETHDVTPGERFNDWLDFVEQERGWVSRNVATDLGELLCDQLESITGSEEAA